MITAATVNAQCDTAITDSTIHTDVGTVITNLADLHTDVGTANTAITNLDGDVADVQDAVDTAQTSIDLILADTGELQAEWVNAGRLDTILDTCAASAADAAALALEVQTDWANGGRLDTLLDTVVAQTVAATVADAVLDEVTEIGMSLRQAVNIILAAVSGKTSGGGTGTLVARDVADTKPRCTLTVDLLGNRTDSVRDGA